MTSTIKQAGAWALGGAALYVAAPFLPEKWRGIARVAGIGLAGYGVLKFFDSEKKTASGDPTGETAIEEAAGLIFGESNDIGHDWLTPSTTRAPTDDDRIEIADQGSAICVWQEFPRLGGTLRAGWFSTSYKLRVAVFNATQQPVAGELRLELEEDYAISDVKRDELKLVRNALPGRVSVYEFELDISSMHFALPDVTGTAKFGNAHGPLRFSVET